MPCFNMMIWQDLVLFKFYLPVFIPGFNISEMGYLGCLFIAMIVLLSVYSAIEILEKVGWVVHYIYVEEKKTYDCVRGNYKGSG